MGAHSNNKIISILSCNCSNIVFVSSRLEPVSKSSHPVPPRGPTDLPPISVGKQLQIVPRGSQLYPAQQTDVFYPDPRGAAPPFEPPPYQAGKFHLNEILV